MIGQSRVDFSSRADFVSLISRARVFWSSRQLSFLSPIHCTGGATEHLKQPLILPRGQALGSVSATRNIDCHIHTTSRDLASLADLCQALTQSNVSLAGSSWGQLAQVPPSSPALCVSWGVKLKGSLLFAGEAAFPPKALL